MKVTCIVPTKNSEEFLKECLLSLRECKEVYSDMEIIVVDNYSTDKTLEIAQDLADKVYTFGTERVAQVSYGLVFSQSDLVYITGSDMIRDKYFIKQCVDKIQEGYDAIYMSVKTDKRVKHFWGKVKALERECYIGTFLESARFFKREVWDELRGFNPGVIGMEEDFQHRLDYHGFKTVWVSAREYHLHEDDSLKKIFCKGFYYGKFQREYLAIHRGRALKQLNPFRSYGRFLKHPVLLIGLIISKLMWYSGGLWGLIWS